MLDQPLRRLGLAGTIAVLAVSAAFGGLEQVSSAEAVSPLVLGDTIEAPPLTITVERAIGVEELAGLTLTDEANRWVLLTATVRNTHDTTLRGGQLQDAVRLMLDDPVLEPDPDSGEVGASAVKVLLDESDLALVQPGLDYPLVLAWEQDGTAPALDEVEVVVNGHTWREDNIDHQMKWLDPTPVATGTVPLETLETTAGETDGTGGDGGGS